MDIVYRVLDSYPDRKKDTKIISHEHNKGLAEVRNTAVRNSTGEYVFHIDSDDFLESTAIEFLVSAAIENNAELIISDYNAIYKDKVIKIVRKVGSKQQYFYKLLTFNVDPCVWGKLIKRSLYVDHDIKCIPGLNIGEDYVVTPRLVYYAKKIEKINMHLYNYSNENINSYSNNYNYRSLESLVQSNIFLTEYLLSLDNAKFRPILMLSKLNIKKIFLEKFYYDAFINQKLIVGNPSLLDSFLFKWMISSNHLLLIKTFSKILKIYFKL
jgi:glycosyltransferase involved in cell wall biosynthesis